MTRQAWLAAARTSLALVVALLVRAPLAQAQTTALYFDSDPGDYIGQGLERTYTAADATFTMTSSSPGVRLSVIGPNYNFWWYLDFDPKTGGPFGVGTYESARRFPTVSQPGLDVSGSGRGCNVQTGRYVVLEYVVGTSGAVTAFAADFEQHCEDGTPALFGAIRYNSSIASLVPFGGAYPVYRLTVPTPAHGRVTATGLDCGSGGSVCQWDLAASQTVTVAATADAGYFFAGWAGDCRGASTTTLRVNGPKVCTAFFEPFTTASPRTLLLVDSQAGDPVGLGLQTVLSPANSSWSVTSGSNGSFVQVAVTNDPERWRLNFSAPDGQPLAVGNYGSARVYWRTPFNGLEVTGPGSTCSRVTGRFVIRELVYGPGGTVVRFAADFEQHCNDLAPGLFGTVRFDSTISEVDPFDGAYPAYELTVAPSANGRVTGGPIDCGGAGSSCTLTLGAAASVALTAQADAGYVFTGWTDDCRGGASTVTVHVNGPKSCSAQFEPLISPSPRNLFFMDSQPGEYLGQGRQWFYNAANSAWTPSASSNGNTVSFTIADDDDQWRLTFSAPTGQPLTVGTYIDVRNRFSSFARFDIWGYGRSCSNATGRFVVHEIAFGPGGAVERFAADFEIHCNDLVPGLYGSVRFNAATDAVQPFGGTYPLYQLTLQRPTHGTITGATLDCGTIGNSCEVTLAGAAHVALSATADAGYLFAGWTGDCHGSATTSVHVNGPKTCGALFEPLVSSGPRTLLYLDSEPSEYVGEGGKWVYAAANSRWTLSSWSSSRHQVSVVVQDSVEEWRLEFNRPSDQALAVGEYIAARRSGTYFNGLSVTRSSRSCSQLTGRFVILELVFGTDGSVQRFAADFEQHCNDGVPGLFGALRYNSTISETRPFAGAYPRYQIAIAPPSHGRVTGTDLNCGGGATACTRTLSGASQVTLVAAADFGYAFMGWTGDCIGAPTITLHVNGPKQCAALFEPAVATSPRTVLRWNAAAMGSTPATSGVFSPANSQWSPGASANASYVRMQIRSLTPTSDTSLFLEFYAPSGESLQVGRRYTTSTSYPTSGAAGFWISRSGSSCTGGEFTIRELAIGVPTNVARFAVEFAATCSSLPAAFTGTLQYNSLVDVAATTLTVEPLSLRFAALHNGATVTTQPSPQTVRITLGSGNVGWSAVASQPWLQLSPASGTGSTVMTVTANLLGGLAGSGSASATVIVTLTDGTGTSRTLNIGVTLHFNGTTSPPFGFVDTPVQNSTGVTGAIPMTGWALDDLEIASLTICRGAVGAETPIADGNCGGAAQIFVGTGAFIEGARPDVQAAYPNHPRADRGGWGFMLLTNMLPNGGNGTFVFYVYARDREGHVVLLGTRTMTCDNAHATAPFGAIDTPAQGDTASGTGYLNFGWVLTPTPKSIPADGSTLMVYVDGVAVGRPTYNNYRADIATLFPGLANSNGAVGYRVLDTSLLPNGLHTIVWTATDSAGITSGIGSRYFRVANGVAASIVETAGASDALTTTADAVDAVAPDASAIVGRRGWSADATWVQYAVGRSGRAVVRGEEIDRFELALGARTGETYAGYLRVGDRLQPLPIGSRLDPTTGSFAWAPGVGFVGVYDLVFVRSRDGAAVGRHEIRVVIQPRGSDRVGAQVVIDTPRSQQDLAQPFLLGGWAVDRDAAEGTGVDAVHVWAHPLTGGAPVFLGAAAIGGTRPDVAAVLGDQFRDAGYNLTVQGLEPGNYDLAVFAWSRVTNGFVPAQVVRVTAR